MEVIFRGLILSSCLTALSLQILLLCPLCVPEERVRALRVCPAKEGVVDLYRLLIILASWLCELVHGVAQVVLLDSE